jgi:hypothetical protein
MFTSFLSLLSSWVQILSKHKSSVTFPWEGSFGGKYIISLSSVFLDIFVYFTCFSSTFLSEAFPFPAEQSVALKIRDTLRCSVSGLQIMSTVFRWRALFPSSFPISKPPSYPFPEDGNETSVRRGDAHAYSVLQTLNSVQEAKISEFFKQAGKLTVTICFGMF